MTDNEQQQIRVATVKEYTDLMILIYESGGITSSISSDNFYKQKTMYKDPNDIKAYIVVDAFDLEAFAQYITVPKNTKEDESEFWSKKYHQTRSHMDIIIPENLEIETTKYWRNIYKLSKINSATSAVLYPDIAKKLITTGHEKKLLRSIISTWKMAEFINKYGEELYGDKDQAIKYLAKIISKDEVQSKYLLNNWKNSEAEKPSNSEKVNLTSLREELMNKIFEENTNIFNKSKRNPFSKRRKR